MIFDAERAEAVKHQVVRNAYRAGQRNAVGAENDKVLNRKHASCLCKFPACGKKYENGNKYR